MDITQKLEELEERGLRLAIPREKRKEYKEKIDEIKEIGYENGKLKIEVKEDHMKMEVVEGKDKISMTGYEDFTKDDPENFANLLRDNTITLPDGREVIGGEENVQKRASDTYEDLRNEPYVSWTEDETEQNVGILDRLKSYF